MEYKKNYTFVQKNGAQWKSILGRMYNEEEKKFPNLQKAMTVGVDKEFRKYIVEGTSAEGWHFTHLQMALEAIFVTKFLKESPSKYDRIEISELKRELNSEFRYLKNT